MSKTVLLKLHEREAEDLTVVITHVQPLALSVPLHRDNHRQRELHCPSRCVRIELLRRGAHPVFIIGIILVEHGETKVGKLEAHDAWVLAAARAREAPDLSPEIVRRYHKRKRREETNA